MEALRLEYARLVTRAGKKWWCAGLFSCALAGLSAAGGAAPQATCGRPGAPPCPLQRWMREQVAAARYEKDLPKLAEHLEQLARWNPEPDEWTKWTRYARDGAAAARAGRRPDSSCRGCHRDYRTRFQRSYRDKQAPPRAP